MKQNLTLTSFVNFIFIVYIYLSFRKLQTLQQKTEDVITQEITDHNSDLIRKINRNNQRIQNTKEVVSTYSENMKTINDSMEKLYVYNNQDDSYWSIVWTIIYVCGLSGVFFVLTKFQQRIQEQQKKFGTKILECFIHSSILSMCHFRTDLYI